MNLRLFGEVGQPGYADENDRRRQGDDGSEGQAQTRANFQIGKFMWFSLGGGQKAVDQRSAQRRRVVTALSESPDKT